MFYKCGLRSTFRRSDDNSTQGSDVVYVIECLNFELVRCAWQDRLEHTDGAKITVSLLTGLIRELRKQLFLSQLVCLF